jgi:hypothetical protein
VTEEGELGRMADRLSELAAMLRDPALDDQRAAELAAEAAALATAAGREVERVSRVRDEELSPPGQEELL